MKSTVIPQEISDNELSDNEDEAKFISKKNYKKKKYKKYIGIMVVLSIIFCVAIVIGIMSKQLSGQKATQTKNIESEQDAFNVLQGLMNNQNFSDNDYNSFQEAFGVFDENNDGFLNITEFLDYFKLQLDYVKPFEQIDVDNDDIISYPESVAFLQEINKIPKVKNNYLEMVNDVKLEYGYEYTNKSVSSFNIFLEYVAILTYFKKYDLNANGYIHKSEYISILAQTEGSFDTHDDKISSDEFFNLLYGNNGDSWKKRAIQTYGDEREEIMKELSLIDIDIDTVKNIDINVCLIKELKENKVVNTTEERRRLGCGYWCYCYCCTSYSCGYYCSCYCCYA